MDLFVPRFSATWASAPREIQYLTREWVRHYKEKIVCSEDQTARRLSNAPLGVERKSSSMLVMRQPREQRYQLAYQKMPAIGSLQFRTVDFALCDIELDFTDGVQFAGVGGLFRIAMGHEIEH